MWGGCKFLSEIIAKRFHCAYLTYDNKLSMNVCHYTKTYKVPIKFYCMKQNFHPHEKSFS